MSHFGSTLLSTAAPISCDAPMSSYNANVKYTCAPKNDLETMRRQPCFIAANGEFVCTDIADGQSLIVKGKL